MDTLRFAYGLRAALALPLGELSPQVTERALQSILNGCVNLFAHTTACVHGESFPCEAARHSPIGCYLLVFTLSVLAVLGHLSVFASLGRLSQKERQVPFSRLCRQLSQRESQGAHQTHDTEWCIEVRLYLCSTNWNWQNYSLYRFTSKSISIILSFPMVSHVSGRKSFLMVMVFKQL